MRTWLRLNAHMSAAEVDAFLTKVDEPARSTLQTVRERILEIVGDGATEGIAYGCPCVKVGGKGVAMYAAFAKHCSYFPMSGSTLATLADELSSYQQTKSSLHFPLDEPLPTTLLRLLIATRRAEIAARGR